MKGKSHTPEQIVMKLREADLAQLQGAMADDVEGAGGLAVQRSLELV